MPEATTSESFSAMTPRFLPPRGVSELGIALVVLVET